MKRLVLLALLAVAAVFVTGRITLGEAGANRYLMNMDALMNAGKADEICATLHDDLVFKVIDNTAPGAAENQGDKAKFCQVIRDGINGLAKVPHQMSVEIADLAVKREWTHPWTSEVTYVEKRSITIQGANITISTRSNDRITLVQTFSGVKMLKLDSETSLEQ